jgi:2-polyprenyl-3-methyl-5-hydroxy-6-metoxy-1,4-benzoquinol methylase
MRPVVQEFVARALEDENLQGAKVLEVGSFNVNGSVRPYIESREPAAYVGLDMREGPGVDVMWNCEHLDKLGIECDLVVSTEMLEHAQNWRECMTQMAQIVAPGGLLLITTVSPGFPYHDFPGDYWRYPLDDLKRIIEALGLEIIVAEESPPGEWMPQFLVGVLARKPLDWVKPGSLDDIVVPRVT